LVDVISIKSMVIIDNLLKVIERTKGGGPELSSLGSQTFSVSPAQVVQLKLKKGEVIDL
jgi:hypothetical protein